MVNDINLKKMYNGVIDGVVLSTKQLKEYGFTQHDITNMINSSIIEREKRGYYKYKDVDNLINYGRELFTNGESDRAYQCFLRCFHIDPCNMTGCFQLFIRSITNKDYERAFKLYDILVDSDNEYYSIDYDLYLFLLSIITDIPEKYKTYARGISYNDIRIPEGDLRYDDNNAYNTVRNSIYKRKFALALKQMNFIINKRGSSTIQDVITIHLISQAIKAEKKNRRTFFDFVSNGQYSEIISNLDEKKERQKLGLFDNIIYTLVKKYLNIMETGIIPDIVVTSTSNLFDAINGNNFKLALSICDDFYKDKEIKETDKVLYYILNDINILINNIKDNSPSLDVYTDSLIKKKEKKKEELITKRREKRQRELEEKRIIEVQNDQLLIDNKYDELLDNKGVILLNPMSDERIEYILELSYRYPNMVAEVISEGDKKRVFLRYKPLISDDIDASEVIEDAKQAYVEKDYKKCIESNLRLIETFDIPRAITYFMIGMSYLKLHQKDKAIEYITIANGVSKNNGEDKEYGDLLCSLKGEIDITDRKKYVKMRESEFDDSIIIDGFDEINNYICESGLDVESACLNLNMQQEEINLINLIYARLFFAMGKDEKAELFLKYVEQKKNKSNKVKRLLFEIRRDKMFYKNRDKNNIKQLSYTLKPKK